MKNVLGKYDWYGDGSGIFIQGKVTEASLSLISLRTYVKYLFSTYIASSPGGPYLKPRIAPS
ncbi:MAG TPA: hypothetical protein EYP28_06380 [Methanophagales archaeon]|nr:hypothetical protein [Methanophagales archaeon]